MDNDSSKPDNTASIHGLPNGAISITGGAGGATRGGDINITGGAGGDGCDGGAINITAGSQSPDGPWSKPDRPSEWAKVFGVDARTFSRWVKAGKIPAKVIDEKNVMVRLDAIPQRMKR